MARRIPTNMRHNKVPRKESRSGWGDKLESTLTAVGVTQDRWASFKERFGLSPTCNCDARKEWLNKLGEELGEAASGAVAKLFGK